MLFGGSCGSFCEGSARVLGDMILRTSLKDLTFNVYALPETFMKPKDPHETFQELGLLVILGKADDSQQRHKNVRSFGHVRAGS